MADQNQLDILRQGGEIWNRWRKQHADIQPNLREADLKGFVLRKIDFSDADLYLPNCNKLI